MCYQKKNFLRILYTSSRCLLTFALDLSPKVSFPQSSLLSSSLPLLSSLPPSSFLPCSMSLSCIAFSFSLWIRGLREGKRGTGDPQSFDASSGFINGNFKRSQKNPFFFLLLLNWEPHLKWPADPREALLSNYLLIHWLNGMERRGIKHGDSLSSEGFETPSCSVQ